MTRFIHDQFAKDYLEELLKDYGEVKPSEKVSGEIKEIDVFFTPANQQLVYNLRENLRIDQELDEDDRELVMWLKPLYQRDREQAKQEGREEGIIDGEKRLIIRLLNRRVGEIDALLIEQIQGLSLEQIKNLGEALLDFSGIADLEGWLNQQVT